MFRLNSKQIYKNKILNQSIFMKIYGMLCGS